MNLKEAFRYQNYLYDVIEQVQVYLMQEENLVKITKRHLRSKADPEAADETEVLEPDAAFIPSEMPGLLIALINERQTLAAAIAKSKARVASEQGFDIDAALDGNKLRQRSAGIFSSILSRKTQLKKELGTAYRINAEGNQSPYVYEIEITAEEVYSRKALSSLLVQITEESEAASAAADSVMITAQVDFTPTYHLTDTLENVFSVYMIGE